MQIQMKISLLWSTTGMYQPIYVIMMLTYFLGPGIRPLGTTILNLSGLQCSVDTRDLYIALPWLNKLRPCDRYLESPESCWFMCYFWVLTSEFYLFGKSRVRHFLFGGISVKPSAKYKFIIIVSGMNRNMSVILWIPRMIAFKYLAFKWHRKIKLMQWWHIYIAFHG